MAYEPGINSAVKITHQADLDGSSDNSLPPLIPIEPAKSNGKLKPLKIQLQDSTSHLQQIHQFTRPPAVQPPPPRMQEPPSQMQSSGPINRNRKQMTESSPTRLNKKIKKGYEMANYDRVLEFKNKQSYMRKTSDGDYQPLQVCGPNSDLKQFGLGVYLYFEFLKRLSVALLLMSIVVIMPMIVSYQGTGLSAYTSSGSYTAYQAKLTLGNISNGGRRDYLIVTIADILSMLILFLFWLHWRSFHRSILQDMEKDHTIVNPVRYVVAVDNFFDETTNTKTLEMDLRAYMDTHYKGAYEVEIVYNYQGNFHLFIEYDELIEEVEKEHQVIKQTNKGAQRLMELQNELEEKEKEILHISQSFQPMYAYVHFRTLKAKIAFLNYCKHFRLHNTLGQGFARALCCTNKPPEDKMFLGKFPVMIKDHKITRPEQINWRNCDMSGASRLVRILCSLFFVVIAILICSALIGICTLYVASSANCQSYVSPTGASISLQISQIQGRNSESDTFCYCNANLAIIYTNAQMNAFCGSVSNKVLITNTLQIGASVVSAVSNVLLAILITIIAKYLLRPNSIPKEYSFIFWGVLISNVINTGIIPLLLNANVFGVEFYTYIKFINFIDFNQLSIFSDFTADWYALISPYYVNFIIIGCLVTPVLSFFVFSFKHCFKMWRIKRNCENNDQKDPLIQKEANEKVLSLEFYYAEECALVIVLLLIGILYSGLLPLMIPILTVGMAWTYFWKRAIVVKYSIKLPADESLNESVINTIPFIILFHSLFSIWSHTSGAIFTSDAPIISINITPFNHSIDRIFNDGVILAEGALILIVIIIDFTLINLLSGLADCCCRDELEVPVQWAAIENQNYGDRIQKTNILGSFKLVHHPTYGHAMKAYNELIFRKKDMEETKDPLNPEFFS